MANVMRSGGQVDDTCRSGRLPLITTWSGLEEELREVCRGGLQ